MRKQSGFGRLWFFGCVVFLSALASLWGCAAPIQEVQPSSGLPTSAQNAADAERFAIPDELQARLDKIKRLSCRVAEKTRPDPRLVAQQSYEDPLGKLERRMLATTLMWLYEVAHDPAPQRLEQRKKLLLVTPDGVATPPQVPDPPPVRFFDENGKEYTKGFVFGATSGAVPLAAQGVDLGIHMQVLPKGSYWARVGRACGEIAVGTGEIILGCVGLGTGATLTGTGGGAPAGIVVIAGSGTLLLNGCATTAHGVGALEQVLREGEPVPDQPAPTAAPAPAPKPAPAPAPKPQTTAPPQVATNAPTKTTTPSATNPPAKTTTPSAKGKTPGQTPPTVAASPPKVHTIRNQHLAGKNHPVTGVPFDADGYPDFRAAGVVEKEVKIKFTGNRERDFDLANKAAGLSKKPNNSTWHHHQDGTTMQLVPTDVHRKTGHTGGMAGTKKQQ